ELSSDLYTQQITSDPLLQLAREYKGMQTVTATKMIGIYNAENIFTAIAAGCFFDVSQDDIEDAVSNYAPSNSRSQLIETRKNRIIMDAYNANPVSMEAAIRNFDRMRGNKSLVILGDMLELGEESDYEHANILKLLTDLDFAEVILVGPLFEIVYGGDDWHIFTDADALCKYIEKNPVKNYDILIKGSRGIGLEKVLPLL
ncbi:MAG: cyanophycin synthetase, partial [Bacteroidales bacterium]|nr:cyanophycin synthetase [Bacteroidales bacterium]